MTIEEIKEAAEKRDIDRILSLAKYITSKEVDEALNIYDSFYEKESKIAQTIQDILARTRIMKNKKKIPSEGSYSYKLEK